MTGAMINACETEGLNEYLFIKNGSSPLTVNSTNIVVRYGTSSPPATSGNITESFSATGSPTYIAALNAKLPSGCDFQFINAIGGSIIPADAFFIVAHFEPTNIYDFSSMCGTGSTNIYVTFSTDASWNSSGEFANTGTTPRYFQTVINGNTVNYEYTPTTTLGGNWNGDVAGNFVTWGASGGTPTSYGNYPGCNTPLPVNLISFYGNIDTEFVSLHWQTSEEIGFSHFEVERSLDMVNFQKINQEDIGTSADGVYKFIDDKPFIGVNYYRLKMVDIDGTEEITKSIAVIFEGKNSIVLYPNPVQSEFSISGISEGFTGEFEIFNFRDIVQKKGRLFDGKVNVENLPVGHYWLILSTSEGAKLPKRFIKH